MFIKGIVISGDISPFDRQLRAAVCLKRVQRQLAGAREQRQDGYRP